MFMGHCTFIPNNDVTFLQYFSHARVFLDVTNYIFLVCIFNDSFRAECVVLLPSNNVAAISNEAIANKMLPWDLTLTRMSEIKNFTSSNWCV